MSSDSLKSFLGRARCSISLLQTTLTLLSLAILNKRSTVYKISCTKCTYSQNVFNTLKAVKINVLYYIVKKNRFIHLLFLTGQVKVKESLNHSLSLLSSFTCMFSVWQTFIYLWLDGWIWVFKKLYNNHLTVCDALRAHSYQVSQCFHTWLRQFQ